MATLKTGSFITPRAKLNHFAVYLVPDRLARARKIIPQHVLDRLVIVAGPFPSQALAVKRLMELKPTTTGKVVPMSAPVPEPVAEHPSYNTVLDVALAGNAATA